MRMKLCILGASFLFLNSTFCVDILKVGTKDLESSISSNIEERPDTRIDNVLLKQLLERVEHVEEENRYLLELVHHLESENANRKKEIHELKVEMMSQKEYTNGLEELIVEMRNSKQNAEIADETKGHKQNTLVEDNRKSSSPAQTPLSSQGHIQSRIRRAPTNLQVAFFASRSQPQLHMGNMQNVLFDHVETNIGNSYDPYIGVFRAPEAGTYVFSTTIGSYDRNSTHFGVYKNTRRVSVIWMNHDYYDSRSQTVILSLNKNDDVTVKHSGTDKAIWGSHYCLFTGFLLYQNESVVDPSFVG